MLSPSMKLSANNIFEEFDDNIGNDGYYEIIRDQFFPGSTSESINIATLHLQQRVFRKGSSFSRVRWLSSEKVKDVLDGRVSKDDFYPPKPHLINIPEGRFNSAGQRVFYLADHPLIGLKECEIDSGDYFLLSFIKISIDMCFVFVEPGKDKLSNLLYQLTQSKDKKFYPVITRVCDEILSFSGYHGLAYNSTKVEEGHIDETWGTVGTTMNLAMAGNYIKNTELSAAWLAFCGEKNAISQHALFKPLSPKKKSKLTQINIRDGRMTFIQKSKNAMSELKECDKKARRLLGQGCHSEFNQFPIKFLWK